MSTPTEKGEWTKELGYYIFENCYYSIFNKEFGNSDKETTMGKLFYSADELLKRPLFPGMHDPTHLYYRFRRCKLQIFLPFRMYKKN
jgi:hypothetical protein